MKHILKYKIFESDDQILDELIDNLSFISDELGQPTVSKNLYDRDNKKYMYNFRWDLKFNITHNNNIKTLEEFHKILTELMDISSAQERMGEYDFEVSIANNINLVVIPKSKSSSEYKFIKGQNWREFQLNKIDIVRFFKDRGISVMKTEEDYQEAAEICSVNIEVSDGSSTEEFKELFMSEFKYRSRDGGDLDREVTISSKNNGKSIEVYPMDEKTFVVI